jgi:hypothetical protein
MDNLETIKKELEEICEKHGVALVPVIVHQGNRTLSSIEIVKIPSETEEQPVTE